MAQAAVHAELHNTIRYERHRPEQTPLYSIIETCYPRFLNPLQAVGVNLPNLAKLLQTISYRLARLLERQGLLIRDTRQTPSQPVVQGRVVSSIDNANDRYGRAILFADPRRLYASTRRTLCLENDKSYRTVQFFPRRVFTDTVANAVRRPGNCHVPDTSATKIIDNLDPHGDRFAIAQGPWINDAIRGAR